MKSINSHCIVCRAAFSMSTTTKRSGSRQKHTNFRMFCSYLNISNQMQSENCQENCFWNFSGELFSFCMECKGAISRLSKFHEQQLATKREIRKIVSEFVKKIVTTETEAVGKENEFERNSQNSYCQDLIEFQGSDEGKEFRIVDSSNSSQLNEPRKFVVKQIIADRIKVVRDSIWRYYNPSVIIMDCKGILPPNVDNELSSSLNPKVECVLSSSSHVQNQDQSNRISEFNESQLNSNQDQQPQGQTNGLETREEASNDENQDSLNSNLESREIVPESGFVNIGDRRVSKRKRKQTEKAKEDNDPDSWNNNWSEKDEDENEWTVNDDQDDDDDNDDFVTSSTHDGQPANKKKRMAKTHSDIGSRLFTIETVEPGMFQYGQWKIEEIVKGKKFKCDTCGQTNTRRSAIIKHINNAHILNIEGYSKVTMDETGIYHYKDWTFEKSDYGFKCLHCGRSRKNKHSLVNHINEIHNEDKLKLTCYKCNKTWNSKEGFDNHKCCPKATTRKTKNVHLGAGKYMYNGVWPYEKLDTTELKCGTCNSLKSTVDRMTAHIREKHIDPTKYVCDMCGYQVGNPSVMKQHRAAHSDVRDVVCDACGKFFKSLSRLSAHKIGHRAERFHCSVCTKSFQYQNGLGRHRRLTGHTEPRLPKCVAHNCPKCERDLRSALRLEKHLTKCIGKKVPIVSHYVCSSCGEMILDEKLLWIHMESIHNISHEDHLQQPIQYDHNQNTSDEQIQTIQISTEESVKEDDHNSHHDHHHFGIDIDSEEVLEAVGSIAKDSLIDDVPEPEKSEELIETSTVDDFMAVVGLPGISL